MFDLMIKGASLTDDEGEFDIACKDGRIVEISKSISGEANEIIHADGCLLSPPFVDPHFHMDATLSLGTQGSMFLVRCWRVLVCGGTQTAAIDRRYYCKGYEIL